MSTKGLQIHPDWIEEIRSTYKCRYLTQEKLAEEADITSLDAVNKFLNGRTISREYFWKLCTLLEFDKEQVIKPRSSISPYIVVKPRTEDSNFEIVVETSQLELEDPNFIGRDNEIGFIHNLTALGNKCILILSSGGVGKTTLAKNYLNQAFGSYIDLNIAKEKQNIVSVASWVEETLRNLKEEPGREFSISLGRLKRKLQQEKIGVLIDNLEPALDRNGQFLPEHRDYFELLRVLSDRSLRSTTLITSREPLNENLDIQNLILGGLKLNVWQQFFKERGIDSDTPILAEVHKAFDGNALAMKVLCEPIRESYEGNIEAYWKDRKTKSGLMVEMAVENLIREQFDRLRDTYPEAYKLLYRMGCFRYQDVPTVPKEGLFSLLWDVPSEQHVRVVHSLKNRFLIEFDKGEYFLHPVIRAEAISRLRASGEWEETNHKAAEFWTKSVKTVESITDALIAFEAYHHCIGINEFDQAASIVLNRRENKWGVDEHLGRSFYRLGLLQQMLLPSIALQAKVSSRYLLSGIYNISGDLHWLTGNIQESINCHQKSFQLADLCLSHPEDLDLLEAELVMLNYKARFNLGLCYIDILEFNEALDYFEQIDMYAKRNDYDSYYKNEATRLCCLALLHSYLSSASKASVFAKQATDRLESSQQDSWSKGYSLLFLGITNKNIEKVTQSFEMYHRAVSFAEQSGYTQVKAKALTGLAELYRLQHNFEAALSHHLESIDLLDKIGARCDLAEAYFQLGLTYQAMSEIEQSLKCRDRAIQLFTAIEAPKQVDRVNQAFEQGAKQ